MEDRNPLPMIVEQAGETPINASNIDEAIVEEGAPFVTESRLDSLSDPRLELSEVDNVTAWISADAAIAVDLAEVQ